MAPRARGRTGRSRIDWSRAGRIALVLLVFGIVVLYVNPLAGFVNAWQETKAERENLAELKQEHRALKSRVAILDSPDATEREAREMGMIGADERAYAVKGSGRAP